MTFRVAVSALAAAAALALAFEEGSAKAAVPSAGGSIPSVSWGGQFYAAPVVDPTLCLAGALDPLNLTCDHFSLDVPAAGTEQVGISWTDPANDFDLRVYDPAGNLVGESNGDGTTSESVAFPAAAAGRYEVRVVPFFVVASGYQGTASWSASGPASRPEPVRTRMEGGGVPISIVADDARFEMDVRVITTPNGQRFQGKVRFKEGPTFLRSQQITIAEGIPHPGDPGGHFTVEGFATCDAGGKGQDFHLEADDNGPGTVDEFTLTAPGCLIDRTSNLVQGNLRFRIDGS